LDELLVRGLVEGLFRVRALRHLNLLIQHVVDNTRLQTLRLTHTELNIWTLDLLLIVVHDLELLLAPRHLLISFTLHLLQSGRL
jgi:hypothetical protein